MKNNKDIELDRLKFVYEQKRRDKDEKDKALFQTILVTLGLVVTFIATFNDNMIIVISFAMAWIFIISVAILRHVKRERPILNELNQISNKIFYVYDKLQAAQNK